MYVSMLDEQLLEQTKQWNGQAPLKSEQAFEALYLRWKKPLYLYLLHLLSYQKDDAEQVLSDVFLSLYEYNMKHEILNTKSFLYSTAHNKALDLIWKSIIWILSKQICRVWLNVQLPHILLARLPLWIVSFPVLMLKENSWKLIQNHFAQKQVLGQLWMKIWENLWWNEFLVRWVSLKSRDNEEWTWWGDGLEDKRKYMFITKKRFSALFHSLSFLPKRLWFFFDQ